MSCLWLHLMKNGRFVSRGFEAGPAAGMAVWQLLGLVTIGSQHALTVASACLTNTMLSCCSNTFVLQPSRAKLSQSRADKCHNRDADYDNQKIEAFVTSGCLRGLVRQAGHAAAGPTHFFLLSPLVSRSRRTQNKYKIPTNSYFPPATYSKCVAKGGCF